MKQKCFIFALAISLIPISGFAEDWWTQDIDSIPNVNDTSVKEADRETAPKVVVVHNASDASTVTYSSNFDRTKKKTSCYYLFKENNFEVNDNIRKCRINEAKKNGHLKACEALSKGSADDFNNCLADRGTSQVSIDERKKYIAELEADAAKARGDEKRDTPSDLPKDFKFTRKNSVAKTFHFWDIIDQHTFPVIHGKTKKPLIRMSSITVNSYNGTVRRSNNYEGINIINTANKMCSMMKDDKGHAFEAVMIGNIGGLFAYGVPIHHRRYLGLNPYEDEDVRERDRKYHPFKGVVGVGEDGEIIENKYNVYAEEEKEQDKALKELGKYQAFIKITCVRRLKDGEEADEDVWKKERNLSAASIDEIVEHRNKTVAQENTVANGAKPIYYWDASGNRHLINGGETSRDTSSQNDRRSQFTGKTAIDAN